MPLTFSPPSETYDEVHLAVVFQAYDGVKPVPCSISVQALQDRFGLRSLARHDALDSYHTHRHTIWRVASDRYDLAGLPVALTTIDFHG